MCEPLFMTVFTLCCVVGVSFLPFLPSLPPPLGGRNLFSNGTCKDGGIRLRQVPRRNGQEVPLPIRSGHRDVGEGSPVDVRSED